ncbi:hypothetical protein Tco_1263574 [Tanacetum coccineum]
MSENFSATKHSVSWTSFNSTNEVNTAYGVSTGYIQVSTASTQVSTASTQVSTANLSDATVYAFVAFNKREELGIQDNRSKNQDNSRRTINVEEISSKAMLAIDGVVLTGAIMEG